DAEAGVPRRDDPRDVRTVPVVVGWFRALNITHAVHAIALQIRMSTVDAGIDDGDLGSHSAMTGNHIGRFRKTTPDDLRLDVEDAINQGVLLSPHSVGRVRLHVSHERGSR